MNKKIISVLSAAAAVVLLIMLLPVSAHAEKTKINSTNFPDDNFRNYVSEYYDLNQDGYLSMDEGYEAKSMILIDVFSEGIVYQDLKGIEYFYGLEELVCRGNNIKSLNLSTLEYLEKLDCADNALTSLNLTNNKKLQQVDCSNNKLKTLKLGTLSDLEELNCYNNQLTGLDVTGCTYLGSLECGKNKLTEIDVSQNTALQYLSCFSNQLTTLDISKNNYLITMDCSSNQLTALYINTNPYIRNLYCSYNSLPGLDFSKNNVLEKLCIEGNPGKKYNVYNTALASAVRSSLGTGDIVKGGTNDLPAPESGTVDYYTNEWESGDVEEEDDNSEGDYTMMASFDKDDVIIALDTPVISAENTGSGVKVSWNTVQSAAKYEVWRAPKGSANYELLKTAAGTSYTDKTAKAGNAYAYRICAKNEVFYSKNAAASITRNPFTDVSGSASYFNAVMWAVNNSITSGTSPTTFSPNADCTRYQFAVMLYKLTGKPPVSGVTLPFTDVNPSASYYNAVCWAYASGIISGTSKTTFSPNAGITRYQVVQMLYKYVGKPPVSGTLQFVDVSTKASYYNAVLWAVQNGITKGTDATHFSPNAVCKRYQLVVFLYKYNNIYHVK